MFWWKFQEQFLVIFKNLLYDGFFQKSLWKNPSRPGSRPAGRDGTRDRTITVDGLTTAYLYNVFDSSPFGINYFRRKNIFDDRRDGRVGDFPPGYHLRTIFKYHHYIHTGKFVKTMKTIHSHECLQIYPGAYSSARLYGVDSKRQPWRMKRLRFMNQNEYQSRFDGLISSGMSQNGEFFKLSHYPPSSGFN